MRPKVKTKHNKNIFEQLNEQFRPIYEMKKNILKWITLSDMKLKAAIFGILNDGTKLKQNTAIKVVKKIVLQSFFMFLHIGSIKIQQQY